ncbi:MAG: hypothetical protein KatS3mg130_1619 [Candidatus Sumerlaea sp.]|jgi:uncharacterized protein YceK|uniref:ABC transporter n=1 Tax=Sumerlaea chitinivorans TaxID=2250252 RepID=A0A2Z4Y352_SUMC1|nr:hypothetical protein BRCON_0276 [Candidatus Sumerlaea chitinivorans]MCX7964402.1 hypothetical protein [Candidatus Sumerlaea chitinivorans]GIX45211.1 MAG: hypothetical protein KatS3mg130_1619 [Candidatus Sumerlaea sp.]
MKAVTLAVLVVLAISFSGCANLKARTAPKAPAAKPAKCAVKTVEK